MTDVKPTMKRLHRIAIVVADLEVAALFFAEAFAFETIERDDEDPMLGVLLGLPDARVRQTTMRLGDQAIWLLAFDPAGRPYPTGGTSTDLWFQHFAIIVSDMEAAYERLRGAGRFSPISEGGPQILPPSSGSVSAFKFRDAEGHPLELLAFPRGEEPAYWRAKAASALFLGIDHSAIAVADTAQSVAFYRACLGLELGAQTDNQGPEQERLDAVPEARVRVTGLAPEVPTPHVELLGYHVGLRRPIAPETQSNDIAASLFVLQSEALSAVVDALRAAKARFLSPGIVTLAGGIDAIAVLDPDGHRIVVMQEPDR